MKYSIFILSCFFLFACGKNQPAMNAEKTATENKNEQAQTPPGKTDAPPPPDEAQSKPTVFQKKLSDGKVAFDISCENGEVSTYKVNCSGFEKSNKNFEGKIEGQLIDAFLLDLNGDNYSEIYLVFNQTGDSGNIMLKGYTSYRNKSAGEIHVKDTDMVRASNTDRVYVENKKLMRSFKDGDGKENTFTYKLSRGEAGYILRPE